MSNFDDLFDDLVPHGTVSYTLDGVFVRCDQPLVLIMKHAGETNAPYMNARRKAENALRATSGDPTPAQIRDALIPVFAEHVVANWRNANGRDGKPIPCAASEVRQLLEALVAKRSGDIVLRAMNYAVDADNFRAPMGTAEALGNG